MHKILTLFLFLACTTISFSQTITLKGKITGPDDFPLEATTVYLTSVKDSSVIDYTITNKNGGWELKTRRIDKPVMLKISYVGFATYKQQFDNLTSDRDFGTIKLADQSTDLNEVVIEAEAPPIRIKSDTLEFNASSFKVRPDSNVEALLKQLPGVDIDSEGKITVNGKEVNQILVNGKPFFDKDGKIALKNLPSEIINKVQVTDTKTKEEELLGKKASSDNASINLTIDEDKNKGIFGKIMGGYGTNDRYESSAMINYFKGKRRITVLASSNNINSTGFSMDEIFDSMGGGRNVYMSSNGSFGVNGIQFGGSGQGITQSTMAGTSYNDEWFKNFSSTMNYFYNQGETENENRTREVTFLPDEEGLAPNRSLITNAVSSTNNTRFAHNMGTEFEYKIDSTSTLFLAPKFVSGNSKVRSVANQTTTDQDGNISNSSDSNIFNESDNRNFSNNVNYRKALKKKGRAIGATFGNDNNLDDASTLNQSTTLLYDDVNNDGTPEVVADIRNQIRHNRQTRDNYNGSFEYLEPLNDSLRLKVGANYSRSQSVQDRVGYNFNETSGRYDLLNDSLTNYLSSVTGTIRPTAGFDYNKKKFNLSVNVGSNITNFDNKGTYFGDTYTVNKDYALPYASANFGMNLSKSMHLWTNYNYNVSFPDATQILPIEDVSNPLNTYVGNANLKPEKSHDIYLSLRDFDFATRSGYGVYGSFNIYDSQIVSFTDINSSSAKRTTSYRNVAGGYQSWFGINWNKTIKRDAHTLRVNAGFNGSYNFEKGFTNSELFEAKIMSFTPRLGLNYDYGDLLTIAPSYSYSYRQSNYTNYPISSTNNFVHTLNLQTTSYWPKNIVFGNDFGYTYNSNISDGFKKDFFLWNTSLGFNFLDDHFLFKVKVYDVLNQNLGTSRSITATTIRDEQNTVLKRYAMFSLTYSLKKFGDKDKKKRGGGRFMMY